MSGKVDDRIINMKFNNAEFQKNVADTNKSLDNLKKGLNLSDQAKGLNDLDKAGKGFSLANIADGVQNIASKFSALSIIGITALANIASKAVDVGLTLARTLTVDPIRAGLQEYELKMGSIQTILANTARHGTGLQQVTSALDELNEYADKTIYNFGDMTRNIGLFTNAGIGVESATSMIKGFSNEAAASGTNAQGAAGAAYQLSQALSAGIIRLMDWRSLQNVGMGNKNMQNGLIEIAQAMGMFNSETTSAEEASANFNGSLEKNWLSADVMSSYLRIMAGDMTAAEQAALGLSDAQIAAFANQQKMAEEAATKVRTWTQLIGTLQEGVGSSWAQTFDILIGDFNEATDLWTAVSDTLGGLIGDMGNSRNELLQAFKDLGGRTAILDSFVNVWKAVQSIIKPISDAFKGIFPPTTADTLIRIANAIRTFTEGLILNEKTQENLRRTFVGVFAVLDIGWMILQKIIGLFGRLFGVTTKGAGGILEFTGSIGDFLLKVRNAIKEGEGLGKVFQVIGDVLEKPIKLLKAVGSATIEFFNVASWAEAWEKVANAMQAVWKVVKPVVDWIVNAFNTVWETVKMAFQNMDFDVLVGLLNVGALTGIGLLIKKFMDKLPGMFSGIGGGLFTTIKDGFGELTKTLQTMQMKLKAEVLTKIAIAIGILTAAVVALSMIDTAQLFIAIGGMGLLMTELMGAMAAMEAISSAKGFNAKGVATSAASMILLATAMLLLSTAVSKLSSLSWEELARGLTGVAGGLLALVGATYLFSKINSAKLVSTGFAMIGMATAMILIAQAAQIFAGLSWEDLGKGGAAIAGFMGAVALFGNFAKNSKGLLAGSAALILASTGMVIFAKALGMFGALSWQEINTGMIAMSIGLGVLATALSFMDKSIVGAAALVVASIGLAILGKTLKSFASFSWDEIGRGAVVLAGSLAILAGGMALMGIPLVLAGTLGILGAAVALTMLAPALKLLSTIPWEGIGPALTILASAIGILAAGGLLLLPALPGLLGLGLAIVMIGAGAALAGSGLLAIAAGITALVAVGAGAGALMKQGFLEVIDLIPMAMTKLAEGFLGFLTTIANGGTELVAAINTLIQSFLKGINENAPMIIDTVASVLLQLLTRIQEDMPLWMEKGRQILVSFGLGLESLIGNLIIIGANLIIAVLNGMSQQLPRITQAASNLVINFINSMAAQVRNDSRRISDAAANLGEALIDGVVQGIGNFAHRIWNKLTTLGNDILGQFGSILGIASPSKYTTEFGEYLDEGIVVGVDRGAPGIYRAISKVSSGVVSAFGTMVKTLNSSIDTDMNFKPTVTPVLDLTSFREDAKKISTYMPNPKLDVKPTYLSASGISRDQRNAEEMRYTPDKVKAGDTRVEFHQTNISPKALSRIEIYRQTNNQLTAAKGVLTKDD